MRSQESFREKLISKNDHFEHFLNQIENEFYL